MREDILVISINAKMRLKHIKQNIKMQRGLDINKMSVCELATSFRVTQRPANYVL